MLARYGPGDANCTVDGSSYPAALADKLPRLSACHLLLELELAQPFDKALVLDLVVAI